MKTIWGLFLLVMFLALPLAAQDTVQEGVIHRGTDEVQPELFVQVAGVDKTGAMLSSCWVLSDADIVGDFGEVDVNWIQYNNIKTLHFFVNYTALFTTKVRFRMIITGPEFYEYTSDTWHNAKYGTGSLYYVWGDKSLFFKSKGVYRVIFIAEQQKKFGGSECLASCSIRVY